MEIKQQIKHRQASVLAVLGSLYCMLATFIIFINHWQESYLAKAGQHRPDETVIVAWIYPALLDIAFIGAALLLASAFLHHREHKRAWDLSMLGILLMVLGTVFPIVGSASAGIFPKYIYVAIPNLALFYIFLIYIRKVNGKIIALATVVGLVYSVSLFNGIASASRFHQHGGVNNVHLFAGEPGYPEIGDSAKFAASMRLNWFACVTWISFMMTMLMKKPKNVLLILSTVAVVLNLFGGILLSLDSIINLGSSFSMFAVAPILAILITAYIASPWSTKTIEGWRNSSN